MDRGKPVNGFGARARTRTVLAATLVACSAVVAVAHNGVVHKSEEEALAAHKEG